MLDPTFAAAFQAAKERIRGMEYRYVEETDQNRQALLEIYCAVVLDTPYNDFGTHWGPRLGSTSALGLERSSSSKTVQRWGQFRTHALQKKVGVATSACLQS